MRSPIRGDRLRLNRGLYMSKLPRRLVLQVRDGLLTEDKATALHKHEIAHSSFSLQDISYAPHFLGGLLLLTGIGFLSIDLLRHFKNPGIMLAALAVVLGAVCVFTMQRIRSESVVSGIMGAAATLCVPLFVFGLQIDAGLWENGDVMRDWHKYVDKRYVTLEVATLVGGGLLYYIYGRSFILMPVALCLVYMSMDVAPLIREWFSEDTLRGNGLFGNYSYRLQVMMYFGAFVALVAHSIERVSKFTDDDVAFWPLLAGVGAFWFGLTFAKEGTELEGAVYAAINVAMILAAFVLHRSIYIILGTLGAVTYFSTKFLMLFPSMFAGGIFLVVAGGLVIGLGIGYRRHVKAQPARDNVVPMPSKAA